MTLTPEVWTLPELALIDSIVEQCLLSGLERLEAEEAVEEWLGGAES